MEPAQPAIRARWEPEEVVPGLYRLPLPYEFAASVNVLLLPAAEGALLVDAGHQSDEAREVLDAHLRALGVARRDIRTILLTHVDHDHMGFAREIQAESGARVLVHERELHRGPLWRGSAAWLEANGYPGTPPLPAVHDSGLPDHLTLVADGDHLRWAGFDLRLLLCPGHSAGLLCAHEEGRRLLLSSDHVLRNAPTPVGLFSPEGDPLGDYLASLERLRGLDAGLVVPGHGRAFGGLEERLSALATGVERDLEGVRGQLSATPATAWEISGRLHHDVDPRRRPVVMFMVLAALRRLARTGAAAEQQAEGRVSYSLSRSGG